MNSDLEHLYSDFWSFISDKVVAGEKPLAVAGIMIAQALTIYKTVLSPEEFNMMVDSISESRDQVKQLTSKDILH